MSKTQSKMTALYNTIFQYYYETKNKLRKRKQERKKGKN